MTIQMSPVLGTVLEDPIRTLKKLAYETPALPSPSRRQQYNENRWKERHILTI